jgi:alanyl-tRNA synthetase
MTQKVFWSAPYQTELSTVLTQVAGDRVQVEQTVFFAFSGGQESDAGTIGGYPVLLAEKQGMDIVYTLPPGHALKVGDRVTLRIDWDRRYKLMRLHFAAEMVLQLVYKHRPGIERIGAHISPDKARIDFASETSLAPLFPVIEQEAGFLTKDDRPNSHRVQQRAGRPPVLGSRRLRTDGMWRHSSAIHRGGWSGQAQAQEYRQGEGADRNYAGGVDDGIQVNRMR